MFLSEDLTNETMETQKAQLDKLKEAKRAGKMAYFVLDILVIKDRRRVESSQVLLFIYLLPYNPLSNNISKKGAALTGCWGFIDGTPRTIAGPVCNQRLCSVVIREHTA